YVHVMNFSGDSITLPAIGKTIKKVKLLTGGAVSMAQGSEGVVLTVPKEYHNDVVTVIELTLDGDAGEIAPVSLPSLSLTAGKKATASNVYQNQTGTYGAQKACDDDDATRWATDNGTKSAWLEVDLGKAETFTQAVIKEAYAGRVVKYELQKLVGDKWVTFHAGTKLGANAVVKFDAVTAQKVRLNILEATDGPTINEFQLLK
ncbi:MAG: discoidin domain-containing protein, partial [Anaerohalosphaera sp.]|nr:discoidin domain-containing protein [Anaerohalosphaera sp.]